MPCRLATVFPPRSSLLVPKAVTTESRPQRSPIAWCRAREGRDGCRRSAPESRQLRADRGHRDGPWSTTSSHAMEEFMRLNRLWPVLAGMLVLGLGAAAAHAQGTTGSVTLIWTAPGDDSLTGTATRYDIRYSLLPITEDNFTFCSGPTTQPRPANPGT